MASRFIFKPSYVDMGFEPSTKIVHFAHTYDSFIIESYPSWLAEEPVLNYSPNDFGTLQTGIGSISITVGYDIGERKYSGIIEIKASSETDPIINYFIPVIYSYDSEHIPISQVVDSVILASGEEGYVRNSDREKALLAAKRWLQDNPRASGKHIRFSERVVEDGRVSVPSDFVDYIGLYTYTDDGFLKPLYVNNDMNVADGYLLDTDNQYILDSNGFAISVTGLTPKPDNDGTFSLPYTGLYPDINSCNNGTFVRTKNIKSGKLSYNGMYRYMPQEKEFIVSNVNTDNLVLQYISDPVLADKMKLDLGDLSVHKIYQDALESYIKYKIVNENRGIRLYDKDRARQEYKLAYKRCERRKLKMSELIQLIRGTNPI